MQQGERSALDGRLRRAQRSHDAIVDAVFELVATHGRMPTARQVAERGGVGERTVFRHFEDLEALFLGVEQRLAQQLAALVLAHPDDPSDPVGGLVRRRVQVYEAMAPFRRASRRFVETSKTVQTSMAHADGLLRLAWRASLGPIVDSEDEHAVDLVLSFDAWDHLRTSQQLSVQEAQATLERLLRAVLARR